MPDFHKGGTRVLPRASSQTSESSLNYQLPPRVFPRTILLHRRISALPFRSLVALFLHLLLLLFLFRLLLLLLQLLPHPLALDPVRLPVSQLALSRAVPN